MSSFKPVHDLLVASALINGEVTRRELMERLDIKPPPPPKKYTRSQKRNYRRSRARAARRQLEETATAEMLAESRCFE
jgi:hypothetical protein